MQAYRRGGKLIIYDEVEVAVREYLSLTASFDHNIIDGAPAARFCQWFKELIESGYGLVDWRPMTISPQPSV